MHPECTADVIALADHVASTTGILKLCQSSPAKEFIVGTEIALLHRLKKENPGKAFYPASRLADCPNMKLNTLEKMVWSLEDMVYEVTVPEPIAGAGAPGDRADAGGPSVNGAERPRNRLTRARLVAYNRGRRARTTGSAIAVTRTITPFLLEK